MSEQVNIEQAGVGTMARVAAGVSWLLAPGHTITVAVLGMSVYSTTRGGHWGAVAIAVGLCAVLPVTTVYMLAHYGVLESRNVRPQRQRFFTLCGAVLAEIVAVTIVWVAGAPDVLVGMLAACLAGLIVLTACTWWVRASIHVGTLTVVAGVVAQISWPVAAAVLVLIVAAVWSRLVLQEHSRAEVIAGLACGLVAAVVAVGTVPA